jgi:hypothetical protein
LEAEGQENAYYLGVICWGGAHPARRSRALVGSTYERCVCMHKRLPRYLVPLLVVLWAILLPAFTAQAAEPVLTITGTGLQQDVLIYDGDWSNYTLVERYYSSNNNFNYHKIWKVKGYDLFELMGVGNLKSQKYAVTFIAKDGARITKTVSDLRSQFYYRKFTADSGEPVSPMIGFYRAVLYGPDIQGLPDPADVIWQDRALTEADKDRDESPRLYFGQAPGQVSENNMSYFLKNLTRIVVGEERLPATDPPDPDNGEKPVETKPKETGSGGLPEKPSPPGSQISKPDPEKEPGSGAAADAEETSGEPNGESAAEEETEDDTITEPDEKEKPQTGIITGKQPRKTGWPWILAGVILIGGLAGGVYYYYIRRRGAHNNDQ